MSSPVAGNRLDEEESPYLRAHADNPVDWQPWDDEALDAARERDVPIFLSIGYAACHWCHVMADESFEDDEVAAVLNDEFVPIKVDREERPDVDSIYQTICQQVTGRGGWPLSVWLTPDGKPFQVGTYFPKEPRRGMPGFGELLERIAAAWNDPDEREKMESRGEQWAQALRGELESVPDQEVSLGEDFLEETAKAAVRGADRQHGGWGRGPKFPQTGRLHVLLRAFYETDRDVYRDVALETLDAMAQGGMYDHVGGGFHRYATDGEWTVPHFEKMLYDNAELPRVYLAAYQLTRTDDDADGNGGDEDGVDDDGGEGEEAGMDDDGGEDAEEGEADGDGGAGADGDEDDELGRGRSGGGHSRIAVPGEAAFYANVARRTLEFVERELQHPDGGFYSTLDAQSEDESGSREEGAYYVWTPEAVHDAVDEMLEADLFCEFYGVTMAGNFEGQSVLNHARAIDALAEEYEMNGDAVRSALESARGQLAAARESRPRPPRDEKILASWNGLAISAFAEASIVLDEAFAEPAVDAIDFLREHLWDEDERRLRRRYADGVTKIDGYLEDYAFLGRGALNLFEATRDVEHLAFALDLGRAIEEQFWDESDETLYFTPRHGEELIARPQELTDQSTPSSAGVAAELLSVLDFFTVDDAFGEIATAVVDTHGATIRSNPLQHSSLALSADTVMKGPLELTLVADDPPADWLDELANRYLGARLLAWRPPAGETFDAWLETLDMDDAPPIWEDRGLKHNKPTLYACRSQTCSPPRFNIVRSLNWAKRML